MIPFSFNILVVLVICPVIPLKLTQVCNKASIGQTSVAAVTRFQTWTYYLNLTLKRLLRSGSRCSSVEQPVPRLKIISKKSPSGAEA